MQSQGKVFLFIELCAGSAVLSAAAHRRGYQVMPVDCKRNRHKPRCKIVQLDLSDDRAWEVLRYIVESCNIACIHMGPPCGTCSRARGTPLADGSPGPPIRRNEQYLLGVPWLGDTDRLKVEAANTLYAKMGSFIEWLDQRNIAWVVENPTNSYLWQLEFFEYAVSRGSFAHCHACAFGSLRAKKTSFLSNRPGISSMQVFCEDVDPHEHAPWGYDQADGFATAAEAQYPDKMCEALMDFIENHCVDDQLDLRPATLQPMRVHKQPRGRATPQLVNEYKRVASTLLSRIPHLDNKKCLTRSVAGVPEGSKLLRTEKKGEKTLCIFGVFHSCNEFVDSSLQLWHPFDVAAHLPDAILRCLHEHLTNSPHELVKLRIGRVKQWTQWARELVSEEAALKSTMSSGVRAILGVKRILLMKKIAEQIQWPDSSLFDEMVVGFRLVGNATKSNVFQSGLKAASISEQQLMNDTKFMKPALLGKIRMGKSSELSTELYDLTVEEASAKGWLDGPKTVAEVDQRFDSRWMPVRRFPVVQKSKLRPIDDFKENRVNDAFSSAERDTLYALDHLVWLTVLLLRLYRTGGEVNFELTDGTLLKGYVHPEWLTVKTELRLTSLDLKSAYKQLPLNPLDYDKSVVSLWDPGSSDVRCFICNTLPFGASSSVHNFLRVSSFLQAAGCYLGILWTSYFDDFPMVSHVLHTSSTMTCAKTLLSLMGFVYAEDKLEPFGIEAEILGVVMDLSDSIHGKVQIRNKPSRVDELSAALDEITSNGYLTPIHMPSILGKLQYADSHVWGRSGRLALADLRDMGRTSPEKVLLNVTQVDAFKVLKSHLCSGKPRTFLADDVQKPALIFTDGALEYDGERAVATIGAVLIFPDGRTEVFGAEVPRHVVESWQSEGKTHVIGLVELYACVCAIKHWSELIPSRRVILFVDNWPALDVLVKGTSQQLSWRRLLLVLEEPTDEVFLLWVARVPSSSNVADHPSRGSLAELAFLKPFQVVHPRCPISNVCLRSIV